MSMFFLLIDPQNHGLRLVLAGHELVLAKMTKLATPLANSTVKEWFWELTGLIDMKNFFRGKAGIRVISF